MRVYEVPVEMIPEPIIYEVPIDMNIFKDLKDCEVQTDGLNEEIYR
jgi:hypothetical protein